MNRIVIILSIVVVLFTACVYADETDKPFAALESKKQFARDIADRIGNAWQKWQSAVQIGEINVEGSLGVIPAGGLNGTFFNESDILSGLDENKPAEYKNCAKVIAAAFAQGMELWQKGYNNENIIFPQGASCSYTLTPCKNVPAMVSSGSSSGDSFLTESALYGYMLKNTDTQRPEVLAVLAASAAAISECFDRWKNSSSIIDVTASGGIAPSPGPTGITPGPVRGAKGHGGRIMGAYFDGNHMYEIMMERFENGSKVIPAKAGI